MIKNVLLLGGGGFVGLNLAIKLLAHGFSVVIIDPNTGSVANNPYLSGVPHYDLPISNVAGILSIIDDKAIDCVVNLASSLLPSSSLEHFVNDMQAVVLPSIQMLDAIAHRDIRYVFFSSGGTVYGNSPASPLDENFPCEPINYYGQSKKTLEDYIVFVHRNSGLEYLIVRPSNPYGRYQNPEKKQGFVTVALHNAINNRPMEIWGDGSVVRDYIYIDDLTEAVCLLLKNGVVNQTFNVGSGLGYSIKEVLTILSDIVHRPIQSRFLPPRKVDVASIILGVAKIKSVIDFQPLALKAGVEKYYEHFLK